MGQIARWRVLCPVERYATWFQISPMISMHASVWRGNSFVTKRDQLCHTKHFVLIAGADDSHGLTLWRGDSFWTKTDQLLDTEHFVLIAGAA
jgi:hypothetical protein